MEFNPITLDSDFKRKVISAKKITQKKRIFRIKKPSLPQFISLLQIAIKNRILLFFKSKWINKLLILDYSAVSEVRKKLLIQRILRFRENSAVIIQKNFKQYINHQNLLSLLQKRKNYYSVYPSIKPKLTIFIKLYTDLRNPLIFKMLHVKFCKIRNCYSFDIPKNKFPSHKKIMRFIFVIDNEEIIDQAYKSVFFGKELVNQIDFKLYDKKIQRLNRFYDTLTNYKKRKNKNKYDDDDEDSDEECSIRSFRSVSHSLCKNGYLRAFKNNYSNNYENNNRNSSKSKKDRTLTDFSECSEKSVSKRKNKHESLSSKSILKLRSRSQPAFVRGKLTKKKVSFGIVQYSY